MPSEATVFYPFHPWAGRTLRVIAWPRQEDGAATLALEGHADLKVPRWMLKPDAAQFAVNEQALLSRQALTAVIDLLARADFSAGLQSSPESAHAASRPSPRGARDLGADSPLKRRTAAAIGDPDGAGNVRTDARATRRKP